MPSIHDIDLGVCDKHKLKISATPCGVHGVYFIGCYKCYFENLIHFKNGIGTPVCSADYRGECSATDDLDLITCPRCEQMTALMRAMRGAQNANTR